MKILSVKITNFRCLKEVEIPLNDMTVFVGRNGTGKSSILKAIDIFYDLRADISEEDFCNRNTDDPIEIGLTFIDFTPSEEEDFSFYIHDNEMIITKRVSWVEGEPIPEYFAYSKQISEFAEIRSIESKMELRRALRALMDENKYPDLEGSFGSAAQALQIMREYEQEHPEYLELIESKGHFLGARNIGGGSLDNYTKFILLPAVKEATEEVEGRDSSFYRLLDAIVLADIESRGDLVDFRDDIYRRIRKVYSPENLGGLDDISSDISRRLGFYAPGSELKLRWDRVTPPQINLPTIYCTLIEDEFEGEISRKGQGVQRALILTLLEYLAASTYEVVEEEAGITRTDIILAIEEPEIYLHPSRCRYFSEVLRQLTELYEVTDETPRIQVIYSTHSPHFVGLDRFDNIRLFRKIRRAGDEIPTTNINFYTLEDASERFAKICKRRPEEISRENFRIRSVPMMTTLTHEGFFADLVILLEGPSDLGALWGVQRELEKGWEKYSIALLPLGNKHNILKAGIIFNGLNIPTYIVFDWDIEEQTTNERILRLLGEPINYPDELVHDTWAIHEINLEETLKQSLGEENFDRIWVEVGTEFKCRPNRIKKNEEATDKFIEIAYELGFSIPLLEQIVKKITKLYLEMSNRPA